MFDDVPDNVRQMRDHDYNYIIPKQKSCFFNHFPQYQLVYNWNNLHLLLESVSEPGKFRSEPKSYFLEKYKTECTKQNCYSYLSVI